jgi:hypothetical protein
MSVRYKRAKLADLGPIIDVHKSSPACMSLSIGSMMKLLATLVWGSCSSVLSEASPLPERPSTPRVGPFLVILLATALMSLNTLGFRTLSRL